MSKTFSFQQISRDGRSRAAAFQTPHGILETPVFAPVGTQASVKGVTPKQLEELGASLVLANTYHLYLRPGSKLISELGGLHEFMQWPHPILTDSGGFQVFSLAERREIDEDGVNFRSHLDGSQHRFTPERAIQIQEDLGADIIMAFDECPEPYDRQYNEQALSRTHAWAVKCKEAQKREDQALFGIVQGGVFDDLRKESAEFIASLDLPGNAIGGLSVGEKKEEMHNVLDIVNGILPEDKPRYLMGVGSPEDLIEGIRRGVDIFDCVLPTRLGRNNSVFLSNGGRLNLKNAEFASEHEAIEADCDCYTCQIFSRAYLRHLINAKEMLSGTLLSIHNLRVLIRIAEESRQAILDQRFEEYAQLLLGESKA